MARTFINNHYQKAARLASVAAVSLDQIMVTIPGRNAALEEAPGKNRRSCGASAVVAFSAAARFVVEING